MLIIRGLNKNINIYTCVYLLRIIKPNTILSTYIATIIILVKHWTIVDQTETTG